MSAWLEEILTDRPPREAWNAIFERLLTFAQECSSRVEVDQETVAPDRVLAESAWDLWERYPEEAPRTSTALIAWWSAPHPQGRAVLILDALSLRELSPLLAAARARGIEPSSVRVTGSELPSETNAFAAALGAGQRSALRDNRAPAGFAMRARGEVSSDVLNLPFADCAARVPNAANVLLWHHWQDDRIHDDNAAPDQIHRAAEQTLRSDDFWAFIARLRQGRDLVITADHGYGIARSFSMEEKDEEIVAHLSATLGASRCAKAAGPPGRFMPPPVLTFSGYTVAVGQRKWKVRGGFPSLCHGGASLLEVAVPFIEFRSA